MDSQGKEETDVKGVRDVSTKDNFRGDKSARNRNDDIMTEFWLTMDIIDIIQQKRLRYFDHVSTNEELGIAEDCAVLTSEWNKTKENTDERTDG